MDAMTLPYFNFYVSDFEADTSHLTIEEDGAYNRLLRLQWKLGGSIPADHKQLMRYMRCNKPTLKRVVLPIIEEFFVEEDGGIFNERLRKEQEKSEISHEKRVISGRKGGEKKQANPMKANETTPSNAEAMLKQPEPEPEPSTNLLTREGKTTQTILEKIATVIDQPLEMIGAPDLANRWVSELKLTHEEIVGEVERVKKRRPDDIPKSLKYYVNGMQELAGRKAMPMVAKQPANSPRQPQKTGVAGITPERAMYLAGLST